MDSAARALSKPGASKPGASKPGTDPAHDVLRAEKQPLDAVFAPRSVAVIGATERPASIGRRVLWALLSSPFGGTFFPVSKERRSVLGIKAYPSVRDVPEAVDLAVVVTPAASVPGVVEECVAAGVKAAIIISAGFREHGAEGAALEQQILEKLRGSRMRVIGPNCLGVMNPLTGLNATFSQTIALPGSVAFISQSGALCTAILDWSLHEMVGFSAFVSVGSMVDVGWGDLIDYLGNDPRTQSIVIYMESIGNARSFLSAAREVSLTKPIIVIKAGRSEAAAKAAASHTGALTGSDEVLDAAFRRSGVLRVNSIADIFYMAEVLSKQPRPKGPRLAILTNAGGPGVLAADGLVASGGKLAELSPASMEALNSFLPPHWSHGNPVDVLGDATPDRYSRALEITVNDPNCDGILILTAPQGLSEPTQIAELLKPHARGTGKPVLACFMGGADVAAGNEILNRAGIPTFQFPDTATRAFTYMWKYSYNLRGLYETPALPSYAETGIDRETAEKRILQVRESGRTVLTEAESKQLLADYGIPTVKTLIASTADEAVARAGQIGYPVVVKLHSYTVTHKSDVKGVRLNLRDAEAVRTAFYGIQRTVCDLVGEAAFQGVTVQPMISREGFELIVGSSIDPQFGPVLLFGAGGLLVEITRDRALALPPLNTTLARRMMEQTRVYSALQGARGHGGVDLTALEALLVRFSQLVLEHPWIKEIDINPLLASSNGLLALDARVVIFGLDVTEDDLPRPAIRPYPSRHVAPWTLKNGVDVVIRPIRPEDEPLLIRFHEELSDRTVYLRYFQPLKLSQRTAHERMTRICFIDYDREMALVAERHNPAGEPEIIGVGRLSKLHGLEEAEVAVLVSDKFQHQGLGTELVRRLMLIAREEKLKYVSSTMLGINREMRAICNRLGFALHVDLEEDLVNAKVTLR
ncbi:MAG TPA: bifunctional acetate--CoA ligase family protein/GNAT family N-acetyltransferase [Terriglobales bacterium]|nr:bifunctional acetate--CoA ligase family protein/GNAT family N-acetyltransferase [Terriglobales bacterium]